MLSEEELHKMNSSEFASYVKEREAKRLAHGKANGKFTVSLTDLRYVHKETGEILSDSDIAENKDLCNIIVLHRIIASKNIGKRVKKGELGGYIESEKNVGWLGLSWVYDDAMVYGDAKVYGNASVKGNAIVNGKVEVYGNSIISGDSIISGNSKIMGKAIIKDCIVSGKSEIFGECIITESDIKDTVLYGNLHLNEVRLRGEEYYLEDYKINNQYKIK